MSAPNEILISLSLKRFYALPENKSDCKHCDFDAIGSKSPVQKKSRNRVYKLYFSFFKCSYPTNAHVLNRVTSDSNLEECIQLIKMCELSGDKAAVFSLGVQLPSAVLKENTGCFLGSKTLFQCPLLQYDTQS